jgi:hypothetical protein
MALDLAMLGLLAAGFAGREVDSQIAEEKGDYNKRLKPCGFDAAGTVTYDGK